MSHQRSQPFRPDRRQVLAGAGAAAGLTLLSRSGFGAANPTGSTKPLVVIFLRGGADALSLVAPVQDQYYQSRRQGLAVPDPGAGSTRWWLPPSVGGALSRGGLAAPESIDFQAPASTLLDVYGQGHLTLAMGVALPPAPGSTDSVALKSHFEAQDAFETGAPPSAALGSGWITRYLSKLGAGTDLRSISHGPISPRSLSGAGGATLAVPDVANFPRPGFEALTIEEFNDGLESLNDPAPGTAHHGDLTAPYLASAGAAIDAQQSLENVFANGQTTTNFPGGAFGELLRKTAILLKDGPAQGLPLDVVHLNMPGNWDTHASQGVQPGSPNALDADFFRLSNELSTGLGAFYDEMGGSAGAGDYHVMVVSEFGRRVVANDQAGTDHGAGGIALFMGDGVQSGAFSQDVLFPGWSEFDSSNPTTTGLRAPGLLLQPGLADEDLAPLVDPRLVIGEVLHKRMGLPLSEVFNDGVTPDPIFPGITIGTPPATLWGIVG